MTVLTQSPSAFFTEEMLSLLNPVNIPYHVALIPDGNRRWAKDHQIAVDQGHREGVYTLMDIVKAAKDLKIKVLSFFIFSTENWNRPQDEIDALMWLLSEFLIDQREVMVNDGIKLETIGALEALPSHVQEILRDTKEATAGCQDITMVFAVNYGGRDDLARACKKIAIKAKEGSLDPLKITEETLSSYLDTASWKDPDLLIRTSGEMRISNFLLWQLSYAEIYITDVLWPAFTPHHLFDGLIEYQKRQRRLGGA